MTKAKVTSFGALIFKDMPSVQDSDVMDDHVGNNPLSWKLWNHDVLRVLLTSSDTLWNFEHVPVHSKTAK
ncbi:hypothetical protein J6590_040197 [Homalodisca vitripennis]|nr:hypothetical protein J6590_040197 [Homalodisca vitripennis]